ncbi:uncharacterized protein LOC122404031 [Colletes gigas]|uniref:uncharacterized protein LOC122404031 n=1 Tax=Colletes gigas TaxID=935657 RepID=UPI001C9B14E5|nr:uncharacterized protein LOC122404031 [Colletes gigas]
MTLSEDQAGLFLTEESARRLWEELKRIHVESTIELHIDIGLELQNIKMNNGELVKDYITRAKNIVSRSASIGYPIEDREVTYHLERGLHTKYKRVVIVLRAQRSLKLEAEECRVSRETEGQAAGNSRDGKVYRMTKRYHYKEPSECFVCGKIGHIAKYYYRNGRTSQPIGNRGKYNNNSNNSRPDYRGRIFNIRREQGNIATAPRNEHTFQVKEKGSYISTMGKENKMEEWTLDSGSTAHMTPNIKYMTNIREYRTNIDVAETNRSLEAEAIGDIRIVKMINGQEETIKIKDVLYVPRLRANLLSVSKLINEGNKVIFENGMAIVVDSSEEMISKLLERNGMFIFMAKPKNSCLLSNEQDSEATRKQSEDWKMHWHCKCDD